MAREVEADERPDALDRAISGLDLHREATKPISPPSVDAPRKGGRNPK
jgi:hypothetical protein